MPDIREVLAALDDADKRLWSQHRTEMRKSYMNAHNSVLGIAAWDHNDDAFIDLIDIKLALLFDKSGRFAAVKEVIHASDGNTIEKNILNQENEIKNILKQPSAAIKNIAQIENEAKGLKLVDQASGWPK